jgi:hypothetical protein
MYSRLFFSGLEQIERDVADGYVCEGRIILSGEVGVFAGARIESPVRGIFNGQWLRVSARIRLGSGVSSVM